MRIATLLLRGNDDLARAFSTKAGVIVISSDSASLEHGNQEGAFSDTENPKNASSEKLDTLDDRGHGRDRRFPGASECYLDSEMRDLDGGIQWNVIAPSKSALNRLIASLESAGANVTVDKITVLRTAKELTAEQERILHMALDLGYYDIPKKIGLDGLAKRLGISKATLDIVLRRAQRKVVASHIGAN